MNKLEKIVEQILKEIKPLHTEGTFASRRTALYNLLCFAEVHHFSEPCQELYDAYTADDKGSQNIWFHKSHAVRLIDKVAETAAKDKYGKLYNQPLLPSFAETAKYFEKAEFPVRTATSIGYLITYSEQQLGKYALSLSTVGQYRHAWLEILQYCIERGSSVHQKEFVLQYAREVTSSREKGTIKEWKWKIRRKAAAVLIEVAETGGFQWEMIRSRVCTCGDEELDRVRDSYVNTLRQRNLEKNYIVLCEYVFRYALKYGEIYNYQQLSCLGSGDVAKMVTGFSKTCTQSSMATILPIMRSVLRSLHEKHILNRDLSGIILSPMIQRNHVRAYIPKSEDARLYLALKNEPARIRAMILLALDLGLRDSDICSLKLSNIDWKQDCIRISQQKTGVSLCLPLLPEVGNALMEYLLDERPLAEDGMTYVFLRKQSPHRKLSSVYAIFSSFFTRHGIHIVNGQSKGSHVFRHTLTYRLLRVKVPHQVITDILGHKSKESDKPYLTMEEDMLRSCALDLQLVGSGCMGGSHA